MTNENILLIGGAGFIGGYLTRDLIKAGARVTIADLKEPQDLQGAKFIKLDILDSAAIDKALPGHTIICNLAAAHRDDIKPVTLYHRVNVDGASMICAAANRHNINRIVFTSSVAVFGTQDLPPDENAPHLATHPYGQTKSKAEYIYLSWQQEKPERYLSIIRPTVVFGPGNRGNVHTLIDQIAHNRFIMVGNGRNKKSMAYVENISAYLTHIILNTKSPLDISNYCDKPDLDMNSLVLLLADILGKTMPKARLPYTLGCLAGSGCDLIAKISGKTLPISKLRVEKFCAQTIFETKAHDTELGFHAPFTLLQGLNQTLLHEYGPKQTAQKPAA